MAKSASDLFRSISARLKDSISSDLVVVSTSLYAKSLITTQLHEEMLEGLDSNSNKAAKFVDVLQDSIDAHTNPEAYLQKVCSALKEKGQKKVVDIVNELEHTLSISVVQAIDSSSASIPIDEPEDTLSAADGTQGKIEKWLKEGKVELKVTRINMHGAPGAGKRCSLHLLLNEDPPPSSTGNTPIACRAVKATRISINGKNKKWERVQEQDLCDQLASHLAEALASSDDVPDHSDKLSLEEPTEEKPIKKKPIDMEIIKKIANALETGKSKKLSTNWVYFIDCGGQPAYQELLPLFTRAAALNIITIDLTKGLDKKCQFQYCISQFTSPINTNLKYSNLDIIRSTISSEAMLNSIEIPYVTEPEKHKGIHPHYLILGTRKELVTGEKLKEMNESLREYRANDKVMKRNERQGSIIFPVNTLLPAGSKEREEASVELCTAISNCAVEMRIELPIRLLTFEISLQREAKKKGRSFLTKEEAIQIGKSLRLDESDIDEALRYLHNVTIILYYHEVLPNIIFVDPKPILDVFSRLIAITYVDHDKLHFIADPPPSIDEKDNLIDFGLFKESLLKIIGKQFFNKDFESSHVIKLLIHLHIIAKVENREEGDYFFPCALPSYDKLNPASKVVRPLLIAWEIHNRGTTTLAIPQGLFPLTIVHLLEKKDKVDFCPVGKGFYRCHDAMSLRVYKDYTIDIINRYTHIEIRFDGCKASCPEIRELVTKAIKRSSKDLNVDDDHIFAFKCPSENEQCYCIVQEDKSSARCTQCRSKCDVLQDDDDSYECWFNNPQLPSPGAESPSTKMQPTKLLDTSNLIDVLDVLGDHEYSGIEYYDLGLCLGLHSRTLNVIKEDNKGDVSSCLRECLTAWLEQRDSVMSRGGPTYDTLIKALRKMGENAVADGIERGINTKQLEEDEVELKATNINMHDAPGADGSQHLLNEPPPEKHTDSTQESESKEESTVPIATVTDKIDIESTVAIATVTDVIDTEKIEKWLKEGEVELEITRINMHGAPGAGKTCSQHLLLNEPPPEKLTDSTPIACPAVKATRISIDHDDNKKWERVEIEDLLNKLAFHFEKKKKDEEISTKVDGTPKPEINASNHSTEQSLEKPTENEPAPTENEPAPTENEAAPTKNEAAPTKNEAAPTKNEAAPTKNEPAPTENEAAPTNNGAAPTEDEAAPTENEPAPTENEAAPTENEPAPTKNEQLKPIESAESIKIKLADTEVIKKIADAIATGKFQELSTNWVYFIDSGGQPAYRELLPLFARGAALNIITIDLTKGLDEKCEFQYRIDQHTLSIDIKLQYSNLDIIQSTISSGAMLNPIEIPYVSVSESDESKHSHYLILGTHIDKLEEKGTLDNMNKKLINEGFNNLIKQNEDGGSVIFPVNTLLPAESKERKEASVKLCTAVSNCRVAMTIKLPIRLFTFEISLQLEAKKKKQSFLTKEEVMELGKPLKLIESDIDKALEFLHNVTIILYYPDVLPNIIFVDPEPILDILSRLIAIRYVDHNNRQFIANPPPSPAITWDLVKYGLFKEDLLKIIGKQKIFNSDFESFHMIDLLKHLHIIAEVKEKKNSCHMIKFLLLRLLQIVTGNKKENKNKYFFPCALPSCGKLNDPPTEIQPLLIAWEIGDSNETTLAIPQGLFTLTIVHLLERKDEVEFSSLKLNPCYRYNNAMSLCVYKKYHIDIINCYTHLEIRVRGRCRDICPKIREIVSKAVKESSKDLKLKKDNKFVFAFKCPLQKTCIVQKDNCSTLCPCEDQCEVLKGDDDSYRCWFSDYQIQSSSSDTVQVPTPPHDALPNEGSCSKEVQNYQSNYIKNPANRNWGCYMFVIFLAVGVVLAGVAMNRFVTVEKNTNNIEKFLTIMTHIATGTLPTQPHQYSTTVNPDNDGVGQLGIMSSNEWSRISILSNYLRILLVDFIQGRNGHFHLLGYIFLQNKSHQFAHFSSCSP